MTLKEALEMKKVLEERTGASYVVMRSGQRSLGVTPFFVRRGR